MNIGGIGSGMLQENRSAQALSEMADQANFAAMLEEHKKKAEEATKPAAEGNAVDRADHAAQKATEQEKLKKVCADFEAMFINLMYREMRNSVPKDALFGKSNAIEIFEDMRDTEMTKHAANAGGIGIAEMMYKQLSMTLDPKTKVHRAEGALPMLVEEKTAKRATE